MLVPIAAVLGAGEGLFLPGSFAIVPSLLPADDLQAGNALTSGGTQLATLAGPALGGVVVAVLGPAPAFALEAVSFVASAVSLAGVRTVQRPAAALAPSRKEAPVFCSRARPAPAPAGDERSVGALAGDEGPGDGASSDGAPTLRRLVASQRVLQLLLAVTVAANLDSGAVGEVALPALAHGPFRAGADGYGGMIAAFGAGALAGTVVAAQVRQSRRPAVVGSVAFLAEAAFLAGVPYLGGAVAAGAALAACGALNAFGNVVMITAFQHWAPAEVMGRLMGLLLLASFGIFPLSVLLGGVVVRDLGPAPVFPISAAVLACAVAVGLSQRSWRLFGSAGTPGDAALPSSDLKRASAAPEGCSTAARARRSRSRCQRCTP